MSKGSNRRPGSGYTDNWLKIWGKKPVNAILWTGNNIDELIAFLGGEIRVKATIEGRAFCIMNSFEDVWVDVGDYIIKENNEYLPCKPELFNKQYMIQ